MQTHRPRHPFFGLAAVTALGLLTSLSLNAQIVATPTVTLGNTSGLTSVVPAAPGPVLAPMGSSPALPARGASTMTGSGTATGAATGAAKGAAAGAAVGAALPVVENSNAPATDAKADAKAEAKPDSKTKADGKPDAKSQAKDDTPPPAESLRETAADEIEFQRFVRSATGQSLKLYGYELFANPASFAAVQAAPMPAGYTLGPGDELVVQVSGLAEINERLVIDRDGRVLIPKAGPVRLAGLPFADAEKVLTAHLGRVFRNFTVSVTMGRLRSIEVFVVGQARKPGKHLVSSLSSLINALFETGGPSANGSLRAIELRRAGKKLASVDLYAFLARGENSADVQLLAGDIIYIPPAGPRAALLGTLNAPAIYELRGAESINDLLALSGGLPTLAAPQKAQLDRVDANQEIARYVQDFALDAQGLGLALKAGDILTIFQISPQIANVVTLQGNVAAPLRYTFRPGMRVSDLLSDKRLLITGSYWDQINRGATSGNYSRPEVNLDYATVQRLDPVTLRTEIIAFDLAKAVARIRTEDLELNSGDIVTVYKPGDPGPETATSITVQGDAVGGVHRLIWRQGQGFGQISERISQLIAEASRLKPPSVNQAQGAYAAADLNLDFATITRRVPGTLRSELRAFNLGKALAGDSAESLALQSRDAITIYGPAEAGPETNDSVLITGEVVGGSKRFVWRPGFTIKDIIPSTQWLVDYYNYWQRPSARSLRNDINWDYAQVIRRVPNDLSNRAITFNLGNAVLRGSAADNIRLEPGDQIALFTTAQMPLPMEKRVQLVTLAGEVNVPGRYQIEPGETLPSLVRRAGGLSNSAFAYGIVFSRESTRLQQQENLDKSIRRLESEVNAQIASNLQNVTGSETDKTGSAVQAQIAGQKILLDRLKSLKASGRISLGMDASRPELPGLTLEDGDQVVVPHRPNFVGVFGEVLAETSFIHQPGNTVADYLEKAGLTRDADTDHIMVVRADGSIESTARRMAFFSAGVSGKKLNPGDTVFVPGVIDRRTAYSQFIQGAKDWTAILYQFGLGAAALKTLRSIN